MLKTYNIYSEGYITTGARAGAQFMGRAKGRNFHEACKNFFRRVIGIYELEDDGLVAYDPYYNPTNNTYYACKLFDNLEEAQKCYG